MAGRSIGDQYDRNSGAAAREPVSGPVILLNGVSSSGKSTLARALQQLLDQPYLHANADVIKEMSHGVPAADRSPPFARDLFMPRLYASIPSVFAALAAGGSHLIIEDVIRPLQQRGYVQSFTAFDVLFIGIHCSLEELERRENARGDRVAGRARSQMEQGLIHKLGIYDLVVDTTCQAPETGALQILDRLRDGAAPDAFDRLARIPVSTLWQMTDAMDRAIYGAAHPGKPPEQLEE
jgi:chloramphenicol 3-O phosphotransferase